MFSRSCRHLVAISYVHFKINLLRSIYCVKFLRRDAPDFDEPLNLYRISKKLPEIITI